MTDDIDNDTLIDKADALMRKRGFNAPPDLTEALALTEADELAPESESVHTPAHPLIPTDEAALEKPLDPPDENGTSVTLNTTTVTTAPAHTLNASIAEQDIPTLTDVVLSDPHPPHHATQSSSLSSSSSSSAPASRPDITLETWLEEALPKIIATTLDRLKDQLAQELRDQLRAEFSSEKTTHSKTVEPPL